MKVPGKTEGSWPVDHTAGPRHRRSKGRAPVRPLRTNWCRTRKQLPALASDPEASPRVDAGQGGGDPGPAGLRPRRTGEGGCALERAAHLLHRRDLDLADALRAHAAFGGELAASCRRTSSLTLSQRSRRCAGCARPARRAPGRCRRWRAGRAGGPRSRGVGWCFVGQVGDRGEAFLARRRPPAARARRRRRTCGFPSPARPRALTFRRRAIVSTSP